MNMELLMSQPSAGSSPDVDVAQLRQRFAELRKRQAAAGRTLAGVAVVVVGLFGAFTYFTVTRVRDNFSQPAVQKAVAERLPEVMPLAGAQIQKAAVAAMPVYRDLAVEQFEKIRPELAAKAMARLDGVPDRAGHMMSERLDASFNKVLKRVEPELRQTFPALTDAQKQQILSDYFHDGIEVRNKEIASHIEAMYTNELSAAHSALSKFDLPADDEKPVAADRMQRDFLHSLLALADYELLNDGGAQPAQSAKAGKPVARSGQASAAE
jgi:hypothetical protein